MTQGINKIIAVVVAVVIALSAGSALAERPTRQAGEVKPTPTSEITRTSRGGSTATSGIQTGEWDLEGPGMFDMFFVSIEIDYAGRSQGFIEEFDPLLIAGEVGIPYVGEAIAPDGCRLFSYSGPMGIPLFVGMCSDGDYYMYITGTDRDLIGDAMDDFAAGEPFTKPRGYYTAM